MLTEAGDKEGFEKAALQLKDKQRVLKEFTQSTGRTLRSDRTAVLGDNKSVAGKAKAVKPPTPNLARETSTSGVPPLKNATASSKVVCTREQLVENARAVYLQNNRATLGDAEALLRFDSLVDGNTDAQLRGYIKKHSKTTTNAAGNTVTIRKTGVAKDNRRGTIELQFESPEVLSKHYLKHQDEFEGVSEAVYIAKANALARAPLSNDVERLTRSDGSIATYKKSINEFLVTKDGIIKTYFKPKDGKEYWKYEHERNNK